MKIFHASLQELESSQDSRASKISFQGKLFIKDIAFSERIYERILEWLRAEENLLSCLIVNMQDCYILWREEAPAPTPVKDQYRAILDRLLHTAPTLAPEPQLLSDVGVLAVQPEDVSALIVPMVKQIVEDILVQKQQISLEHLVDALKITLPDPNIAQQLAQTAVAEMQESGTIAPVSQSDPSQAVLTYRGISYVYQAQSDASDIPSTRQRTYRGVVYIEPLAPKIAPSPPKPRKYRGVTY